MEEKQLYMRAKEAWTWKVWEEARNRKDLMGLHGIDGIALRAAQQKVPAHHRESINRLRDGTFVEPQTHAKYDLAKEVKCSLCGANDSITHRCTSCSGRSSIYTKHAHVVLSWSSWTHAKVLHLLPSCNPQWLPYKTLASQQQDHLETVSVLPDVEHRHLFTDGSCIGGKIPEYALSAWAVVDPKIDSWVARGTLGGLGHGADHAELRAVIQATEMVSLHGNRVTIWTDCAYVAEGMNRMLTDVRDVPQGTHEEDWLELQGLLVDCTTSLSIQHTPGHARCGFVDQDVQDWTARWNDRADREAKAAQRLHGSALLSLHRQLWEVHEREVADLCALQDLHIAVMDIDTKQVRPTDAEEDIGEEGPVDLLVERGCLADPPRLQALPIQVDSTAPELCSRFGVTFVRNMITTLQSWEAAENAFTYQITFLELAYFFAANHKDWLPSPHPHQPNCWSETAL